MPCEIDETFWIAEIDADGKILYANAEKNCDFLKAISSDIIEKNISCLLDKKDADALRVCIDEISNKKLPNKSFTASFGNQYTKFIIYPKYSNSNDIVSFTVTAYDITKRLQAEKDLENTNNTLNLIIKCDAILTESKYTGEFLNNICEAISGYGNHKLVWIGYAKHNKNKDVKIISAAGDVKKYLENISVSWSDNIYSKGAVGKSIKEKKMIMLTDIRNLNSYLPWRNMMDDLEINTVLSIPLFVNNNLFGVLGIYSGRNNLSPFTPEELRIFDSLAKHISYGIKTLRDRRMLEIATQKLSLSKVFYKNLIKIIPEAIILHRKNKILFANNVAKDIFCNSKLANQPIEDILLQESIENTLKHAQRNTCSFKEAVFIKKDGTKFIGEIESITVPSKKETVMLSIIKDVTLRKDDEHYKEELERKKAEFLRSTVYCATDGKLDICKEEEIVPYIEQASLSIDISSKNVVPFSRNTITEFALKNGLPEEATYDLVLGVGEAVGNVVKHALRGVAYAGVIDDKIYVAVKDEGVGINEVILPKVILRNIFSTKKSLGMGYSIILASSDKVLLNTVYGKGTTVIMFKNIKTVCNEITLDNLPNMW